MQKTTKVAYQQVLVRAGWRCENPDCANPPGDWRGVQVHHKKHKGMGGSSDPAVHSLDNLVVLCARCHSLAHGVIEK